MGAYWGFMSEVILVTANIGAFSYIFNLFMDTLSDCFRTVKKMTKFEFCLNWVFLISCAVLIKGVIEV